MITADQDTRQLALCLAALAGFVDSIGFLMLGGFFVSFMSGNTTRLAVGITDSAADWQAAGLLILAFFAGVMTGSATGRIARRRHGAVLLLVSLLLLAAASLGALGTPFLAAMALASAMGAENAVFEQDGEVRIGLTYMTGTLVKMAQRIVGAFMGEDRSAWKPHALLWFSLASGAVIGAFLYGQIGHRAIWVAAVIALGCHPLARRLDREAGAG